MDHTNVTNVAEPAIAPGRRSISAAHLFVTFSLIGLCGFGGVIPWVRRTLVDQKHWLDNREFTELLSIGQILPGATVTNLSVIFGYRCQGVSGALAAVLGILALPIAIVLLLATAYRHYMTVPGVQGALHGMALVGTGLVLATGIRLALGQPRVWRVLVFGGLTFVVIGVLHWPFAAMTVLVPAAVAFEARAQRR
ncbi:chromate transporter [Burkholderia ubonensis]|uniref:chromate transporter n=1 Tax=Burkholderia ubonensis TaxID=101571 RepID=UPI00016A4742|nr:chromate transporter [Burkholderia ubonensis]